MTSTVVAVKIKPCPAPIVSVDGASLQLTNPANTTLIVPTIHRFSKSNKFTFNHVFGPLATNFDVFSELLPRIITNCVLGVNGLVFAYGTTGSGKTYTMMGPPTRP
jgi:kinesin family protein C2/C3